MFHFGEFIVLIFFFLCLKLLFVLQSPASSHPVLCSHCAPMDTLRPKLNITEFLAEIANIKPHSWYHKTLAGDGAPTPGPEDKDELF